MAKACKWQLWPQLESQLPLSTNMLFQAAHRSGLGISAASPCRVVPQIHVQALYGLTLQLMRLMQ